MTSEIQSAQTEFVEQFGQKVDERASGGIMLNATYAGVLLFAVLYFFRPQDFVLSLQALPMAKIAGIFTGATLVAAILMEQVRLPKEAKWMLALFVWLCLAIPGSAWRGGSFALVINGFSKVVLIAIAAMCSVTTLARLRGLILVQTLAMLMMAGLALTHDPRFGRMYGVGAMFADPNDFALNLCIVLPFCIAMMLATRSVLVKVFSAGAASILLLAIVSTYSRGGFLALLAVLFAIWRSFLTRTRPALLVLVLLTACIAVAIVMVGSSSYFQRMETITDVQADNSGSAQQRWALLIRSLELSVKHPLFGVGPGQFEELSGAWHETHNSFTQLSSEAGVPALLLFLVLVRKTFRNLRQAREVPPTAPSFYLSGALYCAMTGYIVGAFFLSTAFWLAPYLLFAYGAAAVSHANDSDSATAASLSGVVNGMST